MARKIYTKFILDIFVPIYLYIICYIFKIQTSPMETQTKRDSLNMLDADILNRQSETARLLSTSKKINDNEERINLLHKQDHS